MCRLSALFALCCVVDSVKAISESLRHGVFTKLRSSSIKAIKTASEPPEITITPPSGLPRTLNKVTAGTYSEWDQDIMVWPLFKNMSNGFFVESGAADGERCSNTLLFEQRGWTGLLVEPLPANIDSIMSKHRLAWTFNGALSPTGKDTVVHMEQPGNWESSSIQNHPVGSSGFDVPASSINSLMDKLGRKTIDFWSLDVEGFEGPVLETTDLEKLEVGVMVIEMNKNEENNNAIHKKMRNAGFERIGTTYYYYTPENSGSLDGIFINPNYFISRNLPVPTSKDLGPCEKTCAFIPK